MPNTYQQQSKTKLIATCVTIIVIAGVVVLVDHLKASKTGNVAQSSQTSAQQSAQAASGTSPDATSSSTATNASSNSYKDGTYTADTEYYVPHGSEDIKVTLTLKDGVVTESSIENSEGDRDSASYQEDFASSYKSYVVGKKIGDIHLSYVAGASDTTQAFNDALSQIESQAQA